MSIPFAYAIKYFYKNNHNKDKFATIRLARIDPNKGTLVTSLIVLVCNFLHSNRKSTRLFSLLARFLDVLIPEHGASKNCLLVTSMNYSLDARCSYSIIAKNVVQHFDGFAVRAYAQEFSTTTIAISENVQCRIFY